MFQLLLEFARIGVGPRRDWFAFQLATDRVNIEVEERQVANVTSRSLRRQLQRALIVKRTMGSNRDIGLSQSGYFSAKRNLQRWRQTDQAVADLIRLDLRAEPNLGRNLIQRTER